VVTGAAVEMTPEDSRAAVIAEQEALLADAQDALRWVADNLRDLWD
jgi:hypothetical protein